MTDRKKSKRQKMRGHSTYGFGSKKKHRGFGNSGGKGNAGTGKRADSKKPSVWNKHYFGSVGFVKKNSPGPVNGVNLSYLNEQIDSLVKSFLLSYLHIDISNMISSRKNQIKISYNHFH